MNSNWVAPSLPSGRRGAAIAYVRPHELEIPADAPVAFAPPLPACAPWGRASGWNCVAMGDGRRPLRGRTGAREAARAFAPARCVWWPGRHSSIPTTRSEGKPRGAALLSNLRRAMIPAIHNKRTVARATATSAGGDEVNFQQLRIIREAARRDYNLTDVANAPGLLPQSGVSRHIRELEEELGLALFIRYGESVCSV